TGGVEAAVFFNIRLPRVMAAALVGAALAAAGASYQTIFRNPLVSPDILGVSAGAGLGAVLGIFIGLPVVGIQGMSFVFGLATVVLVMTVAAGIDRHGDTLTLVLCGIAVGALAGAGISLLKVLADPDDQLPAITFWLLGSLAGVQRGDMALALLPMLLGFVPLFLLRWRVGVLSMGEDEARALGLNTRRLRWIVIAATTLITSASVALAGTIGWIGLMVPHMARRITGARFDRVLPASVLIGATLMVVVDTAARSIATTEIALGILTAVIGAPVFLLLLARRESGWH
ncbi:FecCD family ABC transporter permease, partial [Tropicimonas sp.]|uniref:FecCD family ABC transporter permease n=1 Tax=Tropicimonas sp. TaxID=2067044 RepID=UPI003A89A571